MFRYGWCDGPGAWGWFVLGTAWALMLGVAVWAITRIFPGRAERPARETARAAREALDRRLADGEIDVEAYLALRREIDAPAQVAAAR